MSKNRKGLKHSSKNKGDKKPSPEETYLPELDADLQLPYNPAPPENHLQPLEKPSRKSKKPPPLVQLRNLTDSEVESLREDMNKAGEQVEGRSRHLPQNQKPAR